MSGRVWVRRTATVVVAGALVAAPWVLTSYEISLASRVLVLGLLAMSVNLLTGVAGLPTLGQAAYFGVGAYTAALLGSVGLVQLIVAALAGATAAVVTGSVAVRTRGVTFIMITLAIGELTYATAITWKEVTGGTDGMSTEAVPPIWGMPALRLDGLVYLYVLVVFGVLFALVAGLTRSPFGLALRGIQDNEARLRASGYPVNGYLLGAYTIAGGLAGAAGALWIAVERFVAPSDLGFTVSAMALIAVVIGGTGSMWGALAGTAVVVVVRDYVGNELQGDLAGHGTLLLGVVFVLAVYLLPRGLAGVFASRRRGHPAGGGEAEDHSQIPPELIAEMDRRPGADEPRPRRRPVTRIR